VCSEPLAITLQSKLL